MFCANAAWLALVTLAYNLGRWILRAAGEGWQKVTTGTLRRCLIAVPAVLIHHARDLELRMPTRWPWRGVLNAIQAALRRLPAPA